MNEAGRPAEVRRSRSPSSFPRSAWERLASPLRGARAKGNKPLILLSRAAERPDVRSHAERGNEIPSGGGAQLVELLAIQFVELAAVFIQHHIAAQFQADCQFLRRDAERSRQHDELLDLLTA